MNRQRWSSLLVLMLVGGSPILTACDSITGLFGSDRGKLTGFVKDQHDEPVIDVPFWLMDMKGETFGRGTTSATGHLEIDTKDLSRGTYTLHIEKGIPGGPVDHVGPYYDPYEQRVEIRPDRETSLGTIVMRRWSRVAARVTYESGLPVGYSTYQVLDRYGGGSTAYYPNPVYHGGPLDASGALISYPIPDGEYMLRIRKYNLTIEVIAERIFTIAGDDVDLGHIIITE